MLKGRILVELGRGHETVALLDRLDQLYPNQPLVVLERAQVYDRVGRRAEADALWAQLTQTFPNDPNIQASFQARPPAGP
jgi:Flp pilus assembly protein TadD